MIEKKTVTKFEFENVYVMDSCLPTGGVADMAPQTLDTELRTVISVLQQLGGVQSQGAMPSAATQVIDVLSM